jgi:hypothetical protein
MINYAAQKARIQEFIAHRKDGGLSTSSRDIAIFLSDDNSVGGEKFLKLLGEIENYIKQSKVRSTVYTLHELGYDGEELKRMYHDITGKPLPNRYRTKI